MPSDTIVCGTDLFEIINAVCDSVHEKAWQVRLRGRQAVNAKDLTLILGRFVEILLEEVGADTAGPALQRIDREILGDLESR